MSVNGLDTEEENQIARENRGNQCASENLSWIAHSIRLHNEEESDGLLGGFMKGTFTYAVFFCGAVHLDSC